MWGGCEGMGFDMMGYGWGKEGVGQRVTGSLLLCVGGFMFVVVGIGKGGGGWDTLVGLGPPYGAARPGSYHNDECHVIKQKRRMTLHHAG